MVGPPLDPLYRLVWSVADSSTIREWVKHARKGDARAWAALYVEFWPNVFKAARRQGLDDADAEDVAQRVLAVCLPERLPRLRKYRSAAHFAAWLERMAVNEAHNVRRRRRRRALLDSLPARSPGPGAGSTRPLGTARTPHARSAGRRGSLPRGLFAPRDRRAAGDFRGCVPELPQARRSAHASSLP